MVLVVLVLAAILSLGCGILHGRGGAEGKTARLFVKRRDPSPSFRPHPALRLKLAEAKPFSHPAAELGPRTARSDDADETSCGLKKSDHLETDAVSPYSIATYSVIFNALPVICVTHSVNCVLQMPLSETAETIQAVWVEDDVRICNQISNGVL